VLEAALARGNFLNELDERGWHLSNKQLFSRQTGTGNP